MRLLPDKNWERSEIFILLPAKKLACQSFMRAENMKLLGQR